MIIICVGLFLAARIGEIPQNQYYSLTYCQTLHTVNQPRGLLELTDFDALIFLFILSESIFTTNSQLANSEGCQHKEGKRAARGQHTG